MGETKTEVILDTTATDEEVEAVRQVLDRAGIPLDDIYAGYMRKSADLLPWVILITLAGVGWSVRKFFESFFSELGSEAGKVAAAKIRMWVRELADARRGSRGHVEVKDGAGTTVVLHDELPAEAFERLAQLDWDAQKGSHLVWDSELAQWRDPTRDW